jgi:hypothetical protein
LTSGIAFLCQLSESYLLIGQDRVNPASAIAALAEVTAAHSGSYGMLYCAGPDEQSQAPVAFEDGRALMLPEISLASEGEAMLLPTAEQAYEGMGFGMDWLLIRLPLDLHGSAPRLEGSRHRVRVMPGI